MKLCFIIASRFSPNHRTFLPFMINNIVEMYPEAKIFLVDNNSGFPDFFECAKIYSQVTYLENTSQQKFELGAFNFAARYIFENDLHYDYYICIQDTMVIVNKYNFEELHVKACPISPIPIQYMGEHEVDEANIILKAIGIYDDEKYKGCWCHSFVCTFESLKQIHEWTKDIPIQIRHESEISERYLGKMLYVLNDRKYACIDNIVDKTIYNCRTTDPSSEYAKSLGTFTIKICQGKQ